MDDKLDQETALMLRSSLRPDRYDPCPFSLREIPKHMTSNVFRFSQFAGAYVTKVLGEKKMVDTMSDIVARTIPAASSHVPILAFGGASDSHAALASAIKLLVPESFNDLIILGIANIDLQELLSTLAV